MVTVFHGIGVDGHVSIIAFFDIVHYGLLLFSMMSPREIAIRLTLSTMETSLKIMIRVGYGRRSSSATLLDRVGRGG